MNFASLRRLAVVPIVVLAVQALAPAAGASHSWGGYHWARTANPFTLQLGNNLTEDWRSHLTTTSSDWSASAVLDTTIVAGSSPTKRCTPPAGRVEVCNAQYGSNGWLGLAKAWVTGGHITRGFVKVNDTYFGSGNYNTPAWRNLVMCQEVGHTLGLDHQDEKTNNANLGTCMDYTSNPSTNQHPNQHDYDQLVTIYGHPDSTSTVKSGSAQAAATEVGRADEWGGVARYGRDGRPILFERDLGRGTKEFTWVVWTE